jgi:hypothetical protein
MPIVDRRSFVFTAAASAACGLSRRLLAEAATPGPAFVIDPSKPVAHVPADFTGLSYESSQLVHPRFFHPDNKTLVSFFRTLGDTGVLRIGGNMSAFTAWSPIDPPEVADDKGVENPDAGKASEHHFIISPRAIQNLNGFLTATNWKLIYGLNLERGTPEQAAAEAASVLQICGPRLMAFQLGNEPDLFHHNDDYKDRWKYTEFMAKWNTFQQVLQAKVPQAPLAGPDTSFNKDWFANFAADTKGKTALLTAHYYAEGPPTDPRMNMDRLLTRQPESVFTAVALAKKAGMPYRMSEGNSCYNAGKKGVSDSFGSALWMGDFMAAVASAGATGVNLHGGGTGYYTPIAGSPAEGFSARPDFYGMLFVRPMFGATVLKADLAAQGKNISAFAVQKHGKVTVLAFNKSDEDFVLTIQLPRGYTGNSANITRLTAPAIDSTTGVQLGGAAVAASGTWNSVAREAVVSTNGMLLLKLSAYSAASASFT